MNPIIDRIIFTPDIVPPGGAFVATIEAHDPDERTLTLVGTATDINGNVARASAVLRISDPLTFALLDEVGVGFTITPRAGQAGVFDCVAPA